MGKTAWVPGSLLAVVLSACITIDPNIKYYEVPPGVSQENGATIIGTRVLRNFPFDDETAYVLGVSGDPVRGGKDEFSRPVVLAPGAHRLEIAWTQGSLFGNTNFRISVAKGDRLIIKHQRINKEVARVWLEYAKTNTATGEAVFVRVTAPPGGYVPIFIPSHR